MNIFEEDNFKIAQYLELIKPLKDHRRINKGNIRYSLAEILFLTLSAVISGCNTWESISEYGTLKIDWFRKFFPFKHGIPSHDTLGAFFSAFDKKMFAKYFAEFSQQLATVDSRVVAIDGKAVRGAASGLDKSPLYIVSAFCQANKLSLGQERVYDKSNEITAIPILLENLEIENCRITIDAIGCQTNIAEKIIEKKADYILQVKDNQKDLKEQIQKIFKRQKAKNQHVDYDLGHGRAEIRHCKVIDDLQFLDGREHWPNLKTIIEIRSEVIQKNTGQKSENLRYYISSAESDAKQMNVDIRGHWSIENNLHWNLDVIFKEDQQLKRKGNAVENFNMIIKMALSLIEAETTFKKSKPLKRLKASIDDSYRELILKV